MGECHQDLVEPDRGTEDLDTDSKNFSECRE